MDFKQISDYVERIYAKHSEGNQKQYVSKTELKDFIPVVDDDVARLLKLLLKMTTAKKVLEIGTSIGYSATSMAQVVKEFEGKIITIEYDERVAEQARKNFERAGVADLIEIMVGDAREIVPSLEAEFDLIFLDVDKRLYPLLLDECIRLLKKGGLLVAEDTLFPVIDLDQKWQHLIEPIDKFNNLVAEHVKLDSSIITVGDGVTIAVKK